MFFFFLSLSFRLLLVSFQFDNAVLLRRESFRKEFCLIREELTVAILWNSICSLGFIICYKSMVGFFYDDSKLLELSRRNRFIADSDKEDKELDWLHTTLWNFTFLFHPWAHLARS